jgi:glycosyltransferase involved in cell wall biosynthesis
MSLVPRLSPLDAIRLLRHDVVSSMVVPDGIGEEYKFLIWWLLSGQKEYPAAQMLLTESQRRSLFEPMPGWSQKSGLGMNRLLRFLHAQRPDLQRAFDIDHPVGLWDAVAWFYITGLKELGLTACLDEQTRTALNRPAFPVGQGADRIQPTWMMVLLWRMHPALQQSFDLTGPQGRVGLVRWFVQGGLGQSGLQGLVLAPKPADPVSAESVRQAAPAAVFGLNLIGFAYGELGIGEDVRMAVEACQAAGIPFKVLNIHPGQHLRQGDRWLEAHCTDDVAELPYAINLFCLTGFDTLRVYAEKGTALFDGRYNIGWWPWELPVWPQRWKGAFSVVDEIWAATQFTQQMFRAQTDKPVNLMPLPVSVARVRKMSRRALGLPARKFLFLFIFDFNSYLVRKNPQAVIAAFREAFPVDDKSVGLVLKTMNSRPEDPAWRAFIDLCAQDGRTILLDQTMDREVVLGLVQSCDAYVSLHRSEGFGRTLAEAMLFGKPVVGTDFSGNRDFLTETTGYLVKWSRQEVRVGDYPFVEEADGAYWAEPDIFHAAHQLRQAKLAAKSIWVKQLPENMQKVFSVQAIGAKMLSAIKAV